MDKVRIGLVASGSGTDANAVMTAYRNGQLLPECEVVSLLATKAGAGCLDRATALNISMHIIERYGMFEPDDGSGACQKTQADFESQVSKWLWDNEIQLVFLLGCIHRMPTNCLVRGELVEMFNIHPADPEAHGGEGMYGLAVHKHVLANLLDRISRGMADLEADQFFTYPVVHRVTANYDQGLSLMEVAVPIPASIIIRAQTDLASAAKELQQVVLPIEHLMLPAAVNIAARLILDQNEPSC